MNIIDIITILFAVFLLGAFAVWYYKGGYVYAHDVVGVFKRGYQWIVFEFDNPTARQVKLYLGEVCKSQPLTYFMFGVTFEAFGLGVQGMFGMDTYPLLDFLVAGIVTTALYVYQNKKVKKNV